MVGRVYAEVIVEAANEDEAYEAAYDGYVPADLGNVEWEVDDRDPIEAVE